MASHDRGVVSAEISELGRLHVLPPRLIYSAVCPAYLQTKLTRPLPTKDCGTLRTVLDARTYMLALSQDREHRARWQRACELLLAEADVEAFSRQVELALFYGATLVLT